MGWCKVSISKQKTGKDRRKPYVVRWYGDIQHTGKRKRYAKSFKTKAQAERFRTEKQHELDNGGRPDKASGVTLKKLCDGFLKAKRPNIRPDSLGLYGNTVRRLLDYFGPSKDVSTIRKRDADLFMGQQLHHLKSDRELSPWARAQIVTHCRTIFKQAIRWDMATTNPFAECEKPKLRVSKWHHLKPAEYLRLLDAAPDLRWKCLYAVLYTSGVRMGECFSLTWANVDFERGVIHIGSRAGTPAMPPFRLKAHEQRTIPLPQQTLSILAAWQTQSPEGVPFIFLTADRYQRVLARWRKLGHKDRLWKNEYMVNNLGRDFKSHCRRAQIVADGKLTIHGLRKSYGQNHALNGTPIKTLMYLMGHSNERTTLKYYQQLDPDSAATATAKLDAMLDAAVAKLDAQTDSGAPDSRRATNGQAISEVESGVTTK
jgi:integrase